MCCIYVNINLLSYLLLPMYYFRPISPHLPPTPTDVPVSARRRDSLSLLVYLPIPIINKQTHTYPTESYPRKMFNTIHSSAVFTLSKRATTGQSLMRITRGDVEGTAFAAHWRHFRKLYSFKCSAKCSLKETIDLFGMLGLNFYCNGGLVLLAALCLIVVSTMFKQKCRCCT